MQDNVFDDKTLSALNRLKNAIEKSSRIAVLTGAGVSVPSGIPDFRSATGLYATSVGKYRAEDIISHDFFMLRPDDFYAFYKSKMCYPNAEPNAMHLLLARLEKAGKINAVVTQNIDGLHQKAGSERVWNCTALYGATIASGAAKRSRSTMFCRRTALRIAIAAA